MPNRVVSKIAAHPIDMVNPWLVKATINDQDELMEVMSRIDEIPTSLTIVEQGSFWIGYYQQKKDSSFREQIGNRLKAVRLSKGLNLKQVADLAEMKEATISKIENGKWSVSLDLLERMCKVLDITLTIEEIRND